MKIGLRVDKETIAKKSPGLAYDCELAARIRQSDREALTQLIERHCGRVQSYLIRRLGEHNSTLIETVIASTFSDALKHIGSYASGTASTPMELWLIRLAESKLARRPTTVGDEGRRTKDEGLTTHNEQETAPDTSDLARLRTSMAVLSNRDNAVLSLALFEQLPAFDIAHALGTTPRGALRRLRSALKRVGKELEKQESAR